MRTHLPRAESGAKAVNTNPSTTPRRAALYVRVSTNNRATGNQAVFEQNPDVQERPLRQLAEQRGWNVIQVYSDRMSGSKADRPGLKALMADALRGAFDVVLVWRFDRFARSIEQLVLALAEFRTLGIDFVSAQEALDTSTPMGKAMFTIVGAIAELERNVIRERIMAGLEHARSLGTKSGRQIGRPVVVFDRAQVVKLRAAGRSCRETAAELAISVRTARRVYAQGVAKPLDWEAGISGAMTRVAGA
jgi:DNA invertase Pin-like site-specific DNA recombinase